MKAAVLGSPVGHSLSPVLHRAAYLALGLDGWNYEAIECDEARLPGLMAECGPDWAGLSLTMPLKRVVLGLLDDVEALAVDVGAANTVVFRDGARHGYNTDGPGGWGAAGPGADPGRGSDSLFRPRCGAWPRPAAGDGGRPRQAADRRTAGCRGQAGHGGGTDPVRHAR